MKEQIQYITNERSLRLSNELLAVSSDEEFHHFGGIPPIRCRFPVEGADQTKGAQVLKTNTDSTSLSSVTQRKLSYRIFWERLYARRGEKWNTLQLHFSVKPKAINLKRLSSVHLSVKPKTINWTRLYSVYSNRIIVIVRKPMLNFST